MSQIQSILVKKLGLKTQLIINWANSEQAQGLALRAANWHRQHAGVIKPPMRSNAVSFTELIELIEVACALAEEPKSGGIWEYFPETQRNARAHYEELAPRLYTAKSVVFYDSTSRHMKGVTILDSIRICFEH